MAKTTSDQAETDRSAKDVGPTTTTRTGEQMAKTTTEAAFKTVAGAEGLAAVVPLAVRIVVEAEDQGEEVGTVVEEALGEEEGGATNHLMILVWATIVMMRIGIGAITMGQGTRVTMGTKHRFLRLGEVMELAMVGCRTRTWFVI